jgi:two-component system phosphate regulon sensor histidine kinase PhoR
VFRSRFFWKLWASYATLALATAFCTGLLLERRMEQALMDQVESSLHDKARLLTPYALQAFHGEAPSELNQEMTRLARDTEVRITMILPGGRVLADSDHDPAAMENHLAREEVQRALASEFGRGQRSSRTVGQNMLYVAKAVRRDGRLEGFVRLAVPLRAVEARRSELRATIAFGGLAGVLAALALGLFVARRVTVPLAQMTQVAADMREGNYGSRVRTVPRDEMGELGETLNRLGAKITDQIATISREQAQLRSMIAGMVEGVIAVDQDDRVLFCNRAACQYLGMPETCASGRPLRELAQRAELFDLLEQARAGQRAAEREITVQRPAGDLVLEAHATLFEGGTRSAVVVLEDITSLKRLERIRRDFVANVSHEIKTPLTSIKGYVETLLTGALYDKQNNLRFLHKIDDHVGRLSALVQDLLSLARIESQEGSLPLAPVDWSPILESVMRRHEANIQQRGLQCLRDGGPGLTVAGDPEAMTQVLDNLLDNAIKYTPAPGAIRVSVNRHNGVVLLEVADTGIGIPEQDRERIFERFYRVDKARSRELGGTGLGLSIVKHLVQAMHGEVRVESEVGKGSKFVVQLPAA